MNRTPPRSSSPTRSEFLPYLLISLQSRIQFLYNEYRSRMSSISLWVGKTIMGTPNSVDSTPTAIYIASASVDQLPSPTSKVMSKEFFLPHIARMEGYTPGEQPRQGGYIKLNTNENPYPPSPLALERLRAACQEGLRLYPDSEARDVRQRLGEIFAVSPAQTMVGNGSDELLSIIMRCFAGPNDKVVYPYPTYSYYQKLIQIQDAQEVVIDFDEDFSLPHNLIVEDAKITLVANPNSPSGTLIPYEEIEDLAARIGGILVVDEAYVDFAASGCIRLIDQHPNTIILRTMSKSFSLAGVRLGFGFAAPQLIAGMWKIKDHYNVNCLSLVAAEAALDDIGWMQANAARVCKTRERLTTRLAQLGFSVWDSSANFILARIAAPPTAWLYQELKKRRILVRYFDQSRLRDCLRITVGTDREIDTFLGELEDILDLGSP